MSSRKQDLIEAIRALEEIEARTPVLRPQKTNLPQIAAFNCDADEIGYGGAKFGGKSVLALMFAAYKHHYTKIFRKEYKEHSGMLAFIKEKFGTEGLNMSAPQTWRPPHKRGIKAHSVTFNHLQNGESDLSGHQGVSADGLVVDECVYFTESELEGLIADVRPLDRPALDADGLKCQVLLTFNPPLTMEGWWVVKRFGPWIDKNNPRYPTPFGKVLYTCKIDGEHWFFDDPEPLTHHPKTSEKFPQPQELISRTFFKSTYKDNEVARDNPAYLARLQSLGEKQKRAFLYGEMDASLVDQQGQIFQLAHWAKCVDRWLSRPKPTTPPLCLSIDVASMGNDLFVVMPFWKGGYAGMPTAKKGNEFGGSIAAYNEAESDPTKRRFVSEAQCEFVESYINFELHGDADTIDIIYDSGGGYGDAFSDAWRKRHPKSKMVAFKGAAAAGVNNLYGYETTDKNGNLLPPPQILPLSGMPKISGDTGYNNAITAAWCRAGEMLDHPLFPDICIPDHEELKRQATARVMLEKVAKRVSMEDKVEFSKRLGCSPDFADAFVMGLHYLSVYVAGAEYWKRK